TATLDPVTGAALKTEYDRRERAAFHHDMRTITDPRKRRSHQQRGADVIASMLTGGLLPAADQADPTEGVRQKAAGSVNLIVDIDQLARSDGLVYTVDGAQVPASIARGILCRAQINAWFQQADRRLLDLAYDVDYATPTQRLALATRDSTCRWKHCNTEATRCEAHHLHHREHGGTTNLDNLALLCPHHHDRLHAKNARLVMGDTPDQWRLHDAHGTVISEWTKPPPRQRKRAGKPPNQTTRADWRSGPATSR
ncbi:MAG: HNH endonuclease, partial [Acidimicrobiales bacterium]|nr:HNH endonuclease [Acidimicrobiales bacterium]